MKNQQFNYSNGPVPMPSIKRFGRKTRWMFGDAKTKPEESSLQAPPSHRTRRLPGGSQLHRLKPRERCAPVNHSGPSRLSVLCVLAMPLALTLNVWGAQSQKLHGHVPEAVARLGLQPLGRLPATNRLNLAISLPLHNTNAMAQLLHDTYDPTSPQFRHYLTPEQFTERFGPTKDEYEAVRQFVQKHGLEVTTTFPNRVVLDLAGPVSVIEQAFQITLNTYQHPTEARKFYAPDVEPSVDAGLAVLDISGLNNYALPHPAFHASSRRSSAHPGAGSGTGGSFLGSDMRNAYVPGVTLEGTGQMVGLLAFDAFYADDIAAYEDLAGLPNVPIQVVLLDGFNGIPSASESAEADIDIDMAISMAPGLSAVVVFDAGPNGNLTDILSAMVSRPQIKQFSSSWIFWGTSGSVISASDNLLKEMVLQGQSFFEASGDGDAWYDNPISAAPWLVDDAYVTSVGGTSLTMNGSGASYASETAWNLGFDPPGWAGSAYVGSGGGISTHYTVPSWQQGLGMSANRGSRSSRNFPDVSMIAENFVIVYQSSSSAGWWGTSFAAPLWAGFTALVNQEAAANGRPPVGFLNPALYALGQSANYANSFHDITVGNDATDTSSGLFPAVPGYDLCTGWGTPQGSNLIQALALPETLAILSNSAPLFTGPVGGPFSPTNLATTLTNRIGSLSWALGIDSAWLTASPASGALTGGGPATNVVVTPNSLAASLSAGNYTANLFFTNLDDQSVQVLQIALEAFGPPLITSQPTNETLLEGMTATFSVGTASNAPLSYQWQFNNGSGPTNLTDTGGIAGSATSSLTISNVAPANAGAYSVIVSNAAGALPSASASLTVLTGQAPVIVAQPTNQTVLPGAGATLSVSAVGDPPLSYAWLLNGTTPTGPGVRYGSGGSTLTITNATLSNAGNYSVIVTNNFGSVTSAVAALNVTSVTTAGVTLQTLYSFTNNSFGCLPYAGLLQASDGNFYGPATGGGADGYGTVYRMKPNGAVSLVYTFANSSYGGFPAGALLQGTNAYLYGTCFTGGAAGDGALFRVATNAGGLAAYAFISSTGYYPIAGLIQGQDGNFYGTANGGGAYGYGTVYKLTPNGALTALAAFNMEDGAYPVAPLVQAPNGNLYGVTQDGGTNGGWGTIFQITPAGTLNSLFSFNSTNGAYPWGGLARQPEGNLYGTTPNGGAYGGGTVFELGADGTFTSLYSFTGGPDGSNCYAGLLLASDGNFYGAAEYGGVYGQGTVFRMSPDGTLVPLAQFDGYQGANPVGTLIQGRDGNLYGTTLNGGTGGLGAIYRLSLDGALQITAQPQSQTVFTGDTVVFSIATFGALPTSYQWIRNGTNLVDGGNVLGSSSRVLTLANVSLTDATNYSVIVSNSYGAVTSVQASLQVIDSAPQIVTQPVSQTVLAGTTVTLTIGASGAAPLTFQWQENGTNLVDGGKISGSATPSLTLTSVVPTNSGTYSVLVSNAVAAVFSSNAMLTVLPVASPSANLASLYSFSGINGSTVSSYNPFGGLVQGADTELYGTTVNGGNEASGTAFKLSLSGSFTLLHSFANGLDGANPHAGLVELGAGTTFFGAALGAGPAQYGTLFKLTSAGVLTTLYTFTNADDGGDPLASLVVGNDGSLYGTASTRGTNGGDQPHRGAL